MIEIKRLCKVFFWSRFLYDEVPHSIRVIRYSVAINGEPSYEQNSVFDFDGNIAFKPGDIVCGITLLSIDHEGATVIVNDEVQRIDLNALFRKCLSEIGYQKHATA